MRRIYLILSCVFWQIPLTGVAHTNTWLQPFYEYSKQQNNSELLGYTANIPGIAIGADKNINSGAKIGIAASYAFAKVNPLLSPGIKTDLNTYLATLYGTNLLKQNLDLAWRVVGGVNHASQGA